MTRRYALRDDQWERIKDLLPGRKETVAVTAKDNRLFVFRRAVSHIPPFELAQSIIWDDEYKSRSGDDNTTRD